jgi:Bacteriophage clamp loader A subunit
MADLFKEIVPSILQTKKHCLENEKDYVPFVVNKTLSYHDDCLFYAAEMNQYPGLPHRLQYDFLFHSIKSRRRPFARWVKPEEKNDDIKAVQAYYNYSETKARESLNILTEDQLVMIRKAYTVGEMNE